MLIATKNELTNNCIFNAFRTSIYYVNEDANEVCRDPLTTTSTQETFLQDFLVIQNYYKNYGKNVSPVLNIDNEVISKFKSSSTQWCVHPLRKG